MTRLLLRRKFIWHGLLAIPATWLMPLLGRTATVKRVLPPKDIGFITSKLKVARRNEWTESKPRAWLLRAAGSFDRLTIHHAGGNVADYAGKEAAGRSIEGVRAVHERRQYGDIGYHFIIDYSGRVWEGRSLAYEGAHVSYANERNVGIVLLGNFEEQKPSKRQLESMNALCALLCRHYKVSPGRVYGHRDLGASACPGKHLYPYVEGLRRIGVSKTLKKNSKRKEV